ncbi:MAG: asparagine synthase-related protein, partial [Defluviitaleaceae bacterium]|nr:asparagine synthase-related protein [Defluviitaleaceae bacterium]
MTKNWIFGQELCYNAFLRREKSMSGFCGFTGKIENGAQILSAMAEKIKHRGDKLEIICDDDFSIALRNFDGCDGFSALKNFDGCDDFSALKNFVVNENFFSFVTRNEKNIFAARDRLGTKPLYYAIVGGEFLFASEIKSFFEFPGFAPKINAAALEHYLTFQYSPLAETFFEGVYKLPPAHFLEFCDGKIEITRYWEPKFVAENFSFEEAVEKIETEFDIIMKKHKNSEINFGAFLSGGVDSSFIAASYSKGVTFTVGYENLDYSEIEFAKNFSRELKMENVSRRISADEYFDSLPKILYHMDEPLADPAAAAFFFAGELAAQHVKIAFSGEGADEFFGGYNIYQEPFALRKINFLPFFIRRAVSKFLKKIPFSFLGKNFLIRAGQTVEERFVGNAKIFSQQER